MPVSRTELVAILVIVFAGFAARFAFLNELAIEHFDEGVYASNLVHDEGSYPDRFLYAPPLMPLLIELSMSFFGDARWVPFLPSLILGSLTVPLAWWSVRRWANGAVGVAAASLIALSDFHIAMSRSALTDTPMVFFLLLAVWLIIEALSRLDLRVSVIAGFTTGLAWATKYNGWLPVAIAISGSIAAWLYWPRAKNNSKPSDENLVVTSLISCLIGLALAAAVTWLPVWWDLQPVGGYARVAANHQNYVTGFDEWWPTAVRHEAVQRHYAGWPTLLSGWLAVLCAASVLRVERSTWNELSARNDSSKGGTSNAMKRDVKRSTWNELSARNDSSKGGTSNAMKRDVKRSTWNDESNRTEPLSESKKSIHESRTERSTWNKTRFVLTVVVVAALAGAVVLSPVVALGVWSLTELIASALTLRRNRQDCLQNAADKTATDSRRQKRRHDDSATEDRYLAVEQTHRSWFGVWLHLAWLCGLIFATPLYRPYPRLILPWLCVSCIGSGLAIVRLLRGRLIASHSPVRTDCFLADSSSASGLTPLVDTPPEEVNVGTTESLVENSDFPARSIRPSSLRFIWLTLVVTLCVWRASQSAPAWQERSVLAEVADQAVATAAEDSRGESGLSAELDFIIYVYGEPGLFFHTPRARVAARPVMDLSFAMPGSGHSKVPTFVLAGPHAWKSPQFGEQYRELPDGAMIEIAEFPYHVSDFVLLDDHAPDQLSKHCDDVVKLYRIQFR